MKDLAHLINVSRSGIVVEDDLADILKAGEIAGAGLDVYWSEPADRFDGQLPHSDDPLRDRNDVILTPYVAW